MCDLNDLVQANELADSLQAKLQRIKELANELPTESDLERLVEQAGLLCLRLQSAAEAELPDIPGD